MVPSLTDLIKYARAMEKSITQAKIIEDKSRTASVNKIGQPGRYRQRYESKRKARQPYDMDNQDGIAKGVKREGSSIRICTDMTKPNQAIKRIRHVIPTIEDIKYQVNGAKIFSKVDRKSGYHQLELHEDSRDITTFATHTGLYRNTRLNFGTNLAAEIFHNEMDKRTKNMDGVLSIYDDIFIFGQNQVEHNEAVKNVFNMMPPLVHNDAHTYNAQTHPPAQSSQQAHDDDNI